MGLQEKAFSKAFEKVAKGQEVTLTQHLFRYKLKSPVAWGAVAGVGLMSAGWSMRDGKNRNALGHISSQEGTLSNMVSSQVSPVVQQFQAGKKQLDSTLADKVSRGSLVDGDLVFALHNLR